MHIRPFGAGHKRAEPPSAPYGRWAWGVNALAGLALVGVLLMGGPAAAKDIRLLALGDSLTAGYGLPAEDAFPVQLEAALRERGHSVKVLDGGVSGDTTAGGRARLEWVLGRGPDAVLVALGGNDGLRGLDPAGTRENLMAIVERIQRANLPVLIAGMLAPPNLGSDYAEPFNAVFPDVAEETGAQLYPFFLDGVAATPALNQEDGLHPNAQGVAVMVEHILPAVEGLLARVPEPEESGCACSVQ